MPRTGRLETTVNGTPAARKSATAPSAAAVNCLSGVSSVPSMSETNRRPDVMSARSFLGRLDVAAEAEAHRRQQLFAEGVVAARAEAGEQRRRQHIRRHRLLDRRVDGPAAFAAVGDRAAVSLQLMLAGERLGGQIEQPRGDDTAA